MRFRLLAVGFLIVAIMFPVAALTGPLQQQRIPGIEQKPPEDEERARVERGSQERQADLKRDTDKLLKLATELKQYVDKSNENVLSLDVLKKAEAIEKLARSVKGKMKGYN